MCLTVMLVLGHTAADSGVHCRILKALVEHWAAIDYWEPKHHTERWVNNVQVGKVRLLLTSS